MACNTLKNATEYLKEKNLLGGLRSVSPEDYNAVEQEIKDLEKALDFIQREIKYLKEK